MSAAQPSSCKGAIFRVPNRAVQAHTASMGCRDATSSRGYVPYARPYGPNTLMPRIENNCHDLDLTGISSERTQSITICQCLESRSVCSTVTTNETLTKSRANDSSSKFSVSQSLAAQHNDHKKNNAKKLLSTSYLATVTATPAPLDKGSTVWITPLPNVCCPTNVARSFSLKNKTSRQ